MPAGRIAVGAESDYFHHLSPADQHADRGGQCGVHQPVINSAGERHCVREY